MASPASIEPIKHVQAASNSRSGNSNGWGWFDNPLRTWKRFQVSYYGGKYSIERLLALEEYERHTSLTRMVLVCFGSPLPTVSLVLVQESIPLQDPNKGWRENYGFWIRAAILAMVIAHVVVDQSKYFIDGIAISWYREVQLAICASILFTVVAAFVSAHVMFPVPFFVLTLAPLFYTMYIIAFRVVVGRKALYHIMGSRAELIQYISFLGAQNIMACTYPAYEALFRHAQGTHYQLPVIFLLPFIKVALKNLVMKCVAHMEDMTPEAVIFTVDFFNAVYVSSCMQSASSIVSVVAMVVMDLFQTAIMLYGLHRRTTRVLQRLRRSIRSMNKDQENDNLLSAASSLCKNPEKFERQVRVNVQVYSCLPHVLSSGSKKLLEKLNQAPQIQHDSSKNYSWTDISRDRTSICYRLSLPCTRSRVKAIRPIVFDATNRPLSSFGRSQDTLKKSEAFTTHKTVLRESLEMLFSIECIVTTAYLEAATPVLYCCYVLVMVHLPSSRYHAEMVGVTSENVGSKVQSLFIFGLFQIASFILLAVVIKINCGMHMLHHLAFVMETQTSLIQGKLMAWMVVTLCFRVVHFGVDFTFHFSS